MRYILIINSRSNPKALADLEDAINYLANNNSELRDRIEMRYTEYGGHAADLALEISEQFGDRIVIGACGGDGTIHEIINALAFRKTPVVAIPFGTGNDFVKSVLPKWRKWKMVHILSNLDKLKFKQIDLIKIDSYDVMGAHIPNWSNYCNNVASIGLDTEVQAKAKAIVLAKETKWNRDTAYIRAALSLILGKRAHNFTYKLELETGEIFESVSDRHTLISICNAKYYGGGFCPAPNADIMDGLANVIIIDDVSLLRALYLLALYRFGKHIGHEGITAVKATSGVITSKSPSFQLIGNYDGEDFFGHRVRFEVNPKAVKMGFFPEDGFKVLQ